MNKYYAIFYCISLSNRDLILAITRFGRFRMFCRFGNKVGMIGSSFIPHRGAYETHKAVSLKKIRLYVQLYDLFYADRIIRPVTD